MPKTIREGAERSGGHDRGYTLVEAVVVFAIGAIILVAGISYVRGTMSAYQRTSAARQVLSEIRRMQSLALTRGGLFGLPWGGDPAASRTTDEYRLVRNTTAGCSLPATSASTDGTTVIQSWRHLGDDYGGVTIQSIKDAGNVDVYKIMFNAMGQSVNTCATTNFPVTVTLADALGTTRRIVIQSAGWANLR
jgi:type II secretory pathway pseudopilin PulG